MQRIVSKIVNGAVVKHLAFRFFVTVFVTYEHKTQGTHFCGGVVFDATHVLTSAHCVESAPQRIIVRAFDNVNLYDMKTSEDYRVVAHAVHPLYNKNLLYYDFALLRVDRRFPSTFVEQTAFASAREQWRENGPSDPLYVIGHGVTETGKISEQLRVAKLARVPKEKCAYSSRALGDDICAGGFYPCADGECQDSCQGDSGGPLFQTRADAASKNYYGNITEGGVVVFGLTSRGAACGSNSTPGIYSPIHLALSWFKAVAKNGTELHSPAKDETNMTKKQKRSVWQQIVDFLLKIF